MKLLGWVVLGLLLLPFMELAAFVAVAVAIGLGWALALIVISSVCGLMLLRHGGGAHIARVRAAMNRNGFSVLQADGPGGLVILAGILLLIPGFITDALGLIVLSFPVLLGIGEAIGLRQARPRQRSPDGVLDLEPEQWHRVPDPRLRKDPQRD